MEEIQCKTIYELISIFKSRKVQEHKISSHDDQGRLIVGWDDHDTKEFFYVIAGPVAPMRFEMSDIDEMNLTPKGDGWFTWNEEGGCKIPISPEEYQIMKEAKKVDWGSLGLTHTQMKEMLITKDSREDFFGKS